MQTPSFTLFEPLSYALKTALKKFYVTIPLLILYTALMEATIFILWLFFGFVGNFSTLSPSLGSIGTTLILVGSFFVAQFIISSIALIFIYTSLKWYDSGACSWRQICSHFNQIPTSLFFIIVPKFIIGITLLVIMDRLPNCSFPYSITILLLIATIIGTEIIFSGSLCNCVGEGQISDKIFVAHHGIDKQLPAKTAWIESEQLIASYKNIGKSHLITIIILFALYIAAIAGTATLATNYFTHSYYSADSIDILFLQSLVTCLFLGIYFILQTLATTYMYRSVMPALPENKESVHAEVPL